MNAAISAVVRAAYISGASAILILLHLQDMDRFMLYGDSVTQAFYPGN